MHELKSKGVRETRRARKRGRGKKKEEIGFRGLGLGYRFGLELVRSFKVGFLSLRSELTKTLFRLEWFKISFGFKLGLNE